MSYRAKERLVRSILVALAVWPAAQYTATVYFDVNPWKFFGWAMYTTPAPQLRMGMGELAGGRVDWQKQRPMPREIVEEGFRFLDLRTAYGDLHAPDDLARMALAAFPETEGVAVRVTRLVLERESARTVPCDRVYVYPR